MSRQQSKPASGRLFLWLFLLLLTHAALTLPVAFLITQPTDYSFDEQEWHYPNVLLLAEKWPALDWNQDLLSEIAPGYLYFLAGVAQITGADLHTLRAVNVFISLALLALLYLCCVQRVSPRLACLLLLPLATSNYFIKTAAFIFTDTAGLLLAVAALLLTTREKLTSLNSFFAGVLTACVTLTRQFHFWVAGPLVWRAMEPLLVALTVRLLPEKYHLRSTGKQESLGAVAGASIFHAVTMAVLPVSALLFLIWQWGGVVREPWRAEVMAVSTTGWAYLLALLAVFAPFYLWPLAGMKKLFHEKSTHWALLAGAVFGLFTAVVSPNAYDEAAGHYGGVLWSIVEKLPALYQRSPLFLLLSPLGGMLLALTACWLRAQRDFVIGMRWCVWVCAWASTYLLQAFVFQRYFEAPLLMFLALALAFGLDEEKCEPLVTSLCALTVIQLALTIGGFYSRLPW